MYICQLENHREIAHRTGDKDAWQEVGHIDGFDAADSEANADDEHTANRAHISNNRIHQDVLHHAGKDGDAPLKAQHQNGRKAHANPQRGGEYHCSDKIQDGLNKENFVVAAEPCFDGTDDGHSTHAKEQACGHEGIDKVFIVDTETAFEPVAHLIQAVFQVTQFADHAPNMDR